MRMKFFLFLFFTFFSLSTTFGFEEALKGAIKTLSGKVDTQIDYRENCSSCPKDASQKVQKKRESANLYSESNDKTISLTVLSLDELNALFDELAANPEIPFRYPVDGCYARAQKMVMLMEEKGIISGKGWIQGDLYVDSPMGEINWSYHVAPLVLVKTPKGPVPYIIDPSLSKKAIPFSEWTAIMMKKPDSVKTQEYFTNRFAFSPRDQDQDFVETNSQVIEITNQVLKEFKQLEPPLK